MNKTIFFRKLSFLGIGIMLIGLVLFVYDDKFLPAAWMGFVIMMVSLLIAYCGDETPITKCLES